MKKHPVFKLLCAAVIYVVLFVLGSSTGLIHPACYAYAGTFVPLIFAFVYLYSAANWQSFGAAAILNGFVLLVGIITGEADLPFVIGITVLAVMAEIIRKPAGYDTLKGVRLSFIPLAFSFYAYTSHWWFDTESSLAAAIEEMPAGYADKMEVVINNTPALIVMLILTVPMAFLGIWIAERAMRKQASKLNK